MLWFWVFVSVFSLIGWAGNFVTLDGQRRRLQKSLAIAEDEVAHQTRKRTEIDDQVRRDIREQVIKRGELQNALKEKVAQVENLEKTVEAIMAQIGNRDGSIKALNVTLAKRDTELRDLRDAAIKALNVTLAKRDTELRDLRDAVTRRNAEIEAIAVELDVKTRELAKIMRSWQQHWKSFPIKSVTLGPEHEARAQRNHGGQSLARLNERGGLCPSEAVSVVEDRDWYECTPEHALAVLGPIRADQEGG